MLLKIFRISLHKIRFSLKREKYNGYFTLKRMYVCDDLSQNSSYDEKYFGQTLQRKLMHILFSVAFFP